MLKTDKVRIIVNMNFDRIRRGPVIAVEDVPKVLDMIADAYDRPSWHKPERREDGIVILTRGRPTPHRVQVWTSPVGLHRDAQVTLEDVLDWPWDLSWRERDELFANR